MDGLLMTWLSKKSIKKNHLRDQAVQVFRKTTFCKLIEWWEYLIYSSKPFLGLAKRCNTQSFNLHLSCIQSIKFPINIGQLPCLSRRKPRFWQHHASQRNGLLVYCVSHVACGKLWTGFVMAFFFPLFYNVQICSHMTNSCSVTDKL